MKPSRTRRSRLPALAAAAALLVTGLACATRPEPPRAVILVVVDTLRADHMGTYGYPRPTTPNLDALAEEGAVFERAFSVSTWTLPTFGSIFTGQLPTRHAAGLALRGEKLQKAADSYDIATQAVEHGDRQFVQLDETLPTLAQAFRDRGYLTGAVVNNAFLVPKFGIHRGFDLFDATPRKGQPIRDAGASVERAIELLETAGDEPFFLFLHLMDPHMPYEPPAEVRGTFTDVFEDRFDLPIESLEEVRQLRGRISRGDTYARAFYISVYDEEVLFVDRELGRFFRELRERGIWDDSLVIFTSDHGEELSDHNRWEHGNSISNSVIRVPLILWGPGIPPGRYGEPVSLLDLMPTILDLAGIEFPMEYPGTSLTPLFDGEDLPDRSLIAEGTLYNRERKAIIRWPYKAELTGRPGEALLFDLEADPGEIADLSSVHPEILDEMLRELRATILRETRERSAAQPVDLDSRTLENLRALGYVR